MSSSPIIAVELAGEVYVIDGFGRHIKVTASGAIAGGAGSYVKLSNRQTSGTGGGNATSGAWRALPLNTKDIDADGICTLASNQITLSAGTYKVLGYCPFYAIDHAQSRLYNVSDTALILTGSGVYCSGSLNMEPSILTGTFTIAASKLIEFQYQVETTRNTSGLGTSCGFDIEVFAQIEFTKIA